MERRRYFDFERDEYRESEVIERNGNLVYVEFDDGEADWVTRQELEKL